ncbi:hypothetical protein NL676_030192 [Syzygium grande]|nr:hypothetical protein NL676_030192 [Syzygium grande]
MVSASGGCGAVIGYTYIVPVDARTVTVVAPPGGGGAAGECTVTVVTPSAMASSRITQKKEARKRKRKTNLEGSCMDSTDFFNTRAKHYLKHASTRPLSSAAGFLQVESSQ